MKMGIAWGWGLVAAAAGVQLTAAAAAPATAKPGGAAILLSRVGLSGFKQASAADGFASAISKQCVQAIPDDALAPVYQQLLVTELPAAELTRADTFLATPLGMKFADVIATGGDPDERFTEQEADQILRSLSADEFARLYGVTARDNSRTRPIVEAALHDVMRGCFPDVGAPGQTTP